MKHIITFPENSLSYNCDSNIKRKFVSDTCYNIILVVFKC